MRWTLQQLLSHPQKNRLLGLDRQFKVQEPARDTAFLFTPSFFAELRDILYRDFRDARSAVSRLVAHFSKKQTSQFTAERFSNTKNKWKKGWVDFGNGRKLFMRSRWETNYARYLCFLELAGQIKTWEYEADTFWFDKIKRGTTNYTPDFKVTYPDGHVEYHEVKGWMTPRSRTQIKRMAKYHPQIILRVINSQWFRAHRSLRRQIPGWQ